MELNAGIDLRSNNSFVTRTRRTRPDGVRHALTPHLRRLGSPEIAFRVRPLHVPLR